MKKFKFVFLFMSLSQAVFAKDDVKNYNCQFSSGMGYQKVDISFEKESGNAFSAKLNIIKSDGKAVVEKFRDQLKISKQDGIVYLDSKKNSSINPLADAAYLRFDGVKKVFGFDQLANDLSLSHYTISGPIGNRSSWTTQLTCKLENAVAPTETSDIKIFNGSRNQVKTLEADPLTHPVQRPGTALDK